MQMLKEDHPEGYIPDHVDDVAASIASYAKLFAAGRGRGQADYAKWMLDDLRVNFFAISTRGAKAGAVYLCQGLPGPRRSVKRTGRR
ncbi:hypothetical protein BURKHO8Y_20169 [Burkholderia sp. 8Y]|uniref:hypothetical protein n=1 Tax=Burkholderia sp. 8Y TaxID=2653133 RepID=UPI0012F38363|nr:hypothetical protein BURKHO8Y_20169 [Burkholderia sp. 8Y]